jgi:hypothetical protein
MTALGDSLKNPNAYRGACDDVMRACGVTPEELAELVLATARQNNPQLARATVAEFLGGKTPASEEAPPKPPAPPPKGDVFVPPSAPPKRKPGPVTWRDCLPRR